MSTKVVVVVQPMAHSNNYKAYYRIHPRALTPGNKPLLIPEGSQEGQLLWNEEGDSVILPHDHVLHVGQLFIKEHIHVHVSPPFINTRTSGQCQLKKPSWH